MIAWLCTQDDHWPRAQRLHKKLASSTEIQREQLRSADSRREALRAALARAATELSEREEQLEQLQSANAASVQSTAAEVERLKQEAAALQARCCPFLPSSVTACCPTTHL